MHTEILTHHGGDLQTRVVGLWPRLHPPAARQRPPCQHKGGTEQWGGEDSAWIELRADTFRITTTSRRAPTFTIDPPNICVGVQGLKSEAAARTESTE